MITSGCEWVCEESSFLVAVQPGDNGDFAGLLAEDQEPAVIGDDDLLDGVGDGRDVEDFGEEGKFIGFAGDKRGVDLGEAD